MSPAKLTARRLLSGGVLFVALGAFGAASALPAAADQLVWGNAQSWAANGDVVAGYSTAVGFGGRTESSATAEDVYGPMGEYLRIDGDSHTLVDGAGARAESTVRTASFRMGVADLAAHGMIDVPPEADLSDPSPSPVPSPEEGSPDGDGTTPFGEEPVPGDKEPMRGEEDSTDGEDPSGDGESPQGADPTGGGTSASPDAGTGSGADGGEEVQGSATPTDAPSDEPEETASPTVRPSGDEDVLLLDEAVSDLVSADGNAVEFTLADVTSTATAGYEGVTETAFAHGDLTAFGAPLGPLEAGGDGIVVEDDLEVLDQDGDVALRVPVSVTFVVNETTFEDEDLDWDGRGVRSWMTVRVQVGDAEEDQGFSVDFADAWALGSTYAASTSPVPGDKGGEEDRTEEEAAGRDNRLATTGSSLAALITAAVVAVGGGSAATFLARKRTTAMDDQIGDY